MGAVLIAGFLLTTVTAEPFRTASFWLLMVVGALLIVSAVGWGFTQIRLQEGLSRQSAEASGSLQPTNARRVLGYVGVLIVVALIAVAASMVPSRLAPAILVVYIPIWLFGGWWLRRRAQRRRRH